MIGFHSKLKPIMKALNFCNAYIQLSTKLDKALFIFQKHKQASSQSQAKNTLLWKQVLQALSFAVRGNNPKYIVGSYMHYV